MAQTCVGLAQVIYDVHIDDYARDYANGVTGSEFVNRLRGREHDQEQWQNAYDDFRERVDTPEKLMKWSVARYGPEPR
jgi:hypothetical protein